MKIKHRKEIFLLSVVLIAFLITFQVFSSGFGPLCVQGKESNSEDMTIRLELFTSDIPKTVDFYQKVLGFEKLDPPGPTYQPVQKGQVVLGIGLLESLGDDHYFNSSQSGIQFGYGAEIVLEVKNIQSLYNKVKLTGVKFESELMDRPWGLRDFRILDPNGYYIRVTSKD